MKQVIKSMMIVSQKHFFKSRILMLRIARFTSSWQSSLCCFISSVLIRAKVNFSPGYNRFYWVSFRSSYGSTERMSSDRCDRHFVVNLEINHSFEGNQIVLNEAHVGKGEQLRAGKPRKEDDIEVREHSPEPWWVLTGNTLHEDRHSVSREEFRGLNGLEKKYNLIIVGAGLSGSVIAERASKMLGLKVMWSLESREGGNMKHFLIRVWWLTRESTLGETVMTILMSMVSSIFLHLTAQSWMFRYPHLPVRSAHLPHQVWSG